MVAVFLLLGAALFATVWTTRSSVAGATTAVGRGEAIAIEQAVRADLASLEGPPIETDLADLLKEHADEGLRYIAMVEGRRDVVVLAAGTAVGEGPAEAIGVGRHPQEIDGRIRMQLRAVRRMKTGGRATRFVIEVEPIQAADLREAATRTLAIGVIAAAMLLAVGIFVIRLEGRRQDEERRRDQERRLASLGEMSAVLAHEIKNPLASLKGNAQLLMAMLPDGEKPRAKAARVVDEAVRLEKLTQDLLAFVRTGTIQRAAVDPVALAREVASECAAPAAVTIDATGAPTRWSLDAARIREVLVNLVDNALAAGAPVHVRVGRAQRRLRIDVEDRGPGVPADERDKIFEAFVTSKTHGTGLGLAVVRRVVELHGGTVVVMAGGGDGEQPGALFRVEIPEA
ncbi:MAG: HAMP domain-containing sensor histidine kinase [Proteobacteria bacterium]|nr:HAMP domain-containing sensor histidine kinase [Pseudomonadota bacterium]